MLNFVFDHFTSIGYWLKCFVLFREEYQGVVNDFKASQAELRHLNHRTLWLHGASVGEQTCLLALLRHLCQTKQINSIVLSYTSPDAIKITQRIKAEIPLLSITTIPLLLIKTSTLKELFNQGVCGLVVAEGDLWPKFLRAVPRKTFKLIIDTRFKTTTSKRSIIDRLLTKWAYSRIAKFFNIITVCNETAYHAAVNYVPANKLKCTGSSKADESLLVAEHKKENQTLWSSRLNASNRPVVVFASIRNDEFALITASISKIQKVAPDILLIAAPRYVRKKRVLLNFCKLLEANNITNFTLLSDRKDKRDGLIIVDTIGDLSKILASATMTIVCGSFTASSPGHSILEPAALSCPIIIGPYRRKWEAIFENFISSDGVLVSTPTNIAENVIYFLKNITLLNGSANKIQLLKLKGAGEFHAKIIEENIN